MDHFCACVGVTFDLYIKITPVVSGAHQVMSVVFSFVGGKHNSRTEKVTIQVVILFQGSRFGVHNCSEMIRPWKELHIHTQI